jgi:hypothetical protein
MTPEQDNAWAAARLAELDEEARLAAEGIPTTHSVLCDAEHLADLWSDAENRAEYEALINDLEAGS